MEKGIYANLVKISLVNYPRVNPIEVQVEIEITNQSKETCEVKSLISSKGILGENKITFEVTN